VKSPLFIGFDPGPDPDWILDTLEFMRRELAEALDRGNLDPDDPEA